MDLKIFEDLRAAGVDVDGALQRFSGNGELYQKFLRRFPEDDNYQTLCDAAAREDWDTVLKAAHTLKGVSGNLGMTRLFGACSETVRLLRAGDQAGARTACGEVQAACQAILAVLARV